MKFCTECGAVLENGKCPQCGAVYTADTTPEPATAEATPNSFTPYDPVVVQTNSINSKMKICKHCGAQIAKNVKKCPKCGGKNPKPIYKRVWFWIIVVIVLLVLIGQCGKSDDKAEVKTNISAENAVVSNAEPEKERPAEAADAQQEKAAPADIQTVYHVGDTLHDSKLDIVFMSSGEYTGYNEFLPPADGNKIIYLQFAFINTSKSSDAGVSIFSFDCYADGYACDMYYGGDEDLSATLSAGRSTSGCVYFEVPLDAAEIEVEYEANFITEKRLTFVYEGEQDSGYVLAVDNDATEGALNVGDAIESSQMNIRYLSCFEDSSDNMFIVPKDGYRFITCEFEFENVSDSDEYISSFSFNCYADGRYCEGSYFRDDAIDATLSAGRKVNGTVTFEVPIDATVIEVEYLTNFWTSNRVVFNASEF